MDVLGESEALQQFFKGQDVTGAMENPFVDTSMLEAYISNDLDPGAITLPDSPPDSVSERCSPPQMTDVQYNGARRAGSNPQMGQHSSVTHPKAPCRFSELVLPTHSHLPKHHIQIGLQENFVKPDINISASNSSVQPSYVGVPIPPVQENTYSHPEILIPHSGKRKHSDLCENAMDQMWNNIQSQEGGTIDSRDHSININRYDTDSQNGVSMDWCYPCLKWYPFQPNHWATLYDSSYNELPAPGYQVDADKGFNFSTADDSFVCQKKNHFQVTVHVGLIGCPKYVKTPLGLKPVEMFFLKVLGVKAEATNQVITIEQSHSDRSKKPFNPVRIDLPGDQTTKITLGRLHFGETTANNMRKRGKPNPDQRYFMVVVGLYAASQNQNYLLAAHTSERIIVRASNPSQFENDREATWQRGQTANAVVCHGQVGINTDTPDDALVVCGNVKVMGAVMHPSDRRAKQNIHEVDTTEQLKRISQMRLVEYDYKPDFASKMGVDRPHETAGIIAQEVKEILPSAVKEVGDVTYTNGDKIENFLMVDREQIFMENVGAVKELCKLTDNFEKRVQELEAWNKNLAKLKRIGSMKSTISEKNRSSIFGRTSNVTPSRKSVMAKRKAYFNQKKGDCSLHKVFHIVIMALLGLMAFCVILISALYILTLNEERSHVNSLNESYISESFTTNEFTAFTPHTTLPETASSVYTTANIEIPWPEVSFCNILPCVTVHCCVLQSQRKGISDQSKNRGSIKDHHLTQNLLQSELTTSQVVNVKEINNGDWFDTSIRSLRVMESQQLIDHRYCAKGVHCGNGNYSYIIPINKYTPVNMRITLEMNTTVPLIVYKCTVNLGGICAKSASSATKRDVSQEMSQGYQHFWFLPVAHLQECTYHFRVVEPGLADCRTNQNFAGIFFTDYYFYFYRQCS
ncbi:myelin regulatory factor-like protein isoform X3 [Scyliorhinus canicula]|uniref:myelin regulatory factor-like protein isoform X3 n=1 Tax=Scyliorhinus canicula TaxID=7830 RepID=UPI0018F30B4F|nr:myelin regulatory factor-like protein isoform X3 [Scyliorhinus canicula]